MGKPLIVKALLVVICPLLLFGINSESILAYPGVTLDLPLNTTYDESAIPVNYNTNGSACYIQLNGNNMTYPNCANITLTYIHYNDNNKRWALDFEEQSGDPFDKSQYRNHTTTTGSPAYNASGRHGYAMQFDGSDDRVNPTNDIVMSFANNPLTYMAWVRTADSNGVLIERGGGTRGAQIAIENGVATFSYRWNTGTNITTLVGTTLVNDNEWHHIAGAVNASGSMRLYVDGVNEANSTATINTLSPNDGESIGNITDLGDSGSAVNVSDPYTGLIDEAAIYDRALNETEILAYYAGLNFDGSHQLTIWANDSSNEWNQSSVNFTIDSDIPIAACGTLSVVDETYRIVRNITVNGTCITIDADGIIIDGNNKTITGNETGYGIDNQGGNDSVTITDLIIANFTDGIRGIGMANSTIANNTFIGANVSGTQMVNLFTGSDNNTISGNTISVIGGGGRGINIGLTSVANNITNNTIAITGSSGQAIFIADTGTTGNVIAENDINASGSLSIGLYTTNGAANNSFTANIIQQTGGEGIFIDNPSWGNTFTGGLVNNSGREAIFIRHAGSDNNTFTNVTVTNTDGSFYDLHINTAGIDGTVLTDTPVGRYLIAGSGGTLTIENSTAGKIEFLTSVNGTGESLSEDAFVMNNLAHVNESQSGLNKSANITFYSMPGNFITPTMLRNGIECDTGICTNHTPLNDATVVFSVTGWSNYSVGNGLTITIVSPQNTTYPDSAIDVTYNTTNQSGCKLQLNGVNMSYPLCSNTSISYVHFNDSGKAAAYDFAEGTGSITYDRAGQNNATITNAVFTTGQYGYGLQFDGNGDTMSPDSPDPGLFHDATSIRSVALWMKTNQTGTTQTLYDEGGFTNGFYIGIQNNGIRYSTQNADTLTSINYPLVDTDWHFIAAVYNNSNMTLYLDGTPVNSSTTTYSTISAHANAPGIGYTDTNDADEFGSTGRYFNGTIDEIAIYTNALSDQTVAALYTDEAFNGTHTLTAWANSSTGEWVNDNVTFTIGSSSCNPVTGADWHLALSDNCTISSIDVSVENWIIYSNGDGEVRLVNANITYKNRTIGAVSGIARLLRGDNVRLIGDAS